MLRAAGVGYWGPGKLRDGRMEGLLGSALCRSPDVARAEKSVASALARKLERTPEDALVISDENLLGYMSGNMSQHILYPDAANRLIRLHLAFGARCRRIGLAIRCYDALWRSQLSHTMRKEGRGTSALELAELAAQPRRWRDVVTEIARAFPHARLVVWPHEAMAGRPDQTLRALGAPRLEDAALPEQADWHNLGPDTEALRAALPSAADRDSLGARQGAWQPFNAPACAHMRRAYARDIAWLQGGADGLARFLAPRNFQGPDPLAADLG